MNDDQEDNYGGGNQRNGKEARDGGGSRLQVGYQWDGNNSSRSPFYPSRPNNNNNTMSQNSQ